MTAITRMGADINQFKINYFSEHVGYDKQCWTLKVLRGNALFLWGKQICYTTIFQLFTLYRKEYIARFNHYHPGQDIWPLQSYEDIKHRQPVGRAVIEFRQAMKWAGCTAVALVGTASLISCAPSSMGESGQVGPSQAPLYTQAQTIGLEDSDRINRFQRLAQADGIEPPTVEQIYAPAGTVPGSLGPVPVVKVTFDEGVFFDTAYDIPRPEALAVLNLIAQNMQRDVPDAALTIIGNTDSVGSDAYNDDLSQRRAAQVMKILAGDGLDPLQMTTVAIGDREPVAPNDTPEGRAKNRRVEFLISASVQANLAAVQHQVINPDFLKLSDSSTVFQSSSAQENVTVLQAQSVSDAGVKTFGLLPVGPMEIQQSTLAPSSGAVRTLAPPPDIQLRDLQPVTVAELNNTSVE